MTVSGTEIKEGKTSPPKHFTEDTLLSAMETAGADEMPDEVERKGLGTPATRAGIIEKLVRIGFLERKGDKKTKHLIPTHKGTALVTVMPEQIQSPSMTADWEEKLLLIEKGEYASEDFMDEIKDVIAGLIQNYEVIRDSEVMMSKEANSIGKCPLCGSAVEDKAKAFSVPTELANLPSGKQSLLCEHRQEHDFCHGAEIAWFRQGKAQELQVRKNGQHL